MISEDILIGLYFIEIVIGMNATIEVSVVCYIHSLQCSLDMNKSTNWYDWVHTREIDR